MECLEEYDHDFVYRSVDAITIKKSSWLLWDLSSTRVTKKILLHLKFLRKTFSSLKRSLLIMQHGIPAHIAECARSLYRECLRRADYVGSQQGNRETLISLVRQQFRRNMLETDPKRIEEQKQAAARALFNHMYYEAERRAAQQAEDALIKEQLLGLQSPVIGDNLQDENADAQGERGTV